jgi:GNAT superfamily N-acetyltransferase
VRLRAALASDEPFLLGLFSERKRAELAVAGWPEPVLEAFVRQQATLWLRARRSLEILVLEHEGRPVGSLVLAREAAELRLVELVTAAAERRKGFARTALSILLRRADEAGQDVVLLAERGNPAEGLYRALGFEDDGVDGLSRQLRRRAR